jgi:hypothetical protein
MNYRGEWLDYTKLPECLPHAARNLKKEKSGASPPFQLQVFHHESKGLKSDSIPNTCSQEGGLAPAYLFLN